MAIVKYTTTASSNDESVSGNLTAAHPLKRMQLEWKGQVYKFAVNPEDYTQSEPNKITVTQTKGGAWIDAWGEGIKEITLKGTTGVRGMSQSDQDEGYRRWKALRNLIQDVYNDVQDGQKVELMLLRNYTDNEYFYVYPAQGGIELYRNKARPNIYQYTLHLIAVRRLGEPEKERQVLGDPGKTTRQIQQEAHDGFVDMLDKVHSGEANITQLVQYVKDNQSVLS